MNDEFITPQQVADILKIGKRTVLNLIRDGKLQHTIISGEKRKTYRIYRADIERFVAEDRENREE